MWKRPVVWGSALAVLIAAAAFWAFRSGDDESAVRFETVAADKGRVVAKVTATGALSALVTVQVGSQVSGRISELRADFNSVVKKGDVLARIDPQLFQAAMASARANHMASQANLTRSRVQAEDARRQSERSRNLLERKLIAQAEFDTSLATADAARAQVEASASAVQQTRAALDQAEVNLTYTSIISPINGVVISRSVELGQTVAASLQTPTLFIIAEDLRKMQVEVSVPEGDIGKLKDGMEAVFTVDAYPSERFKGTLRQIRNAAETVQNVVTYDAILDVQNGDLKLKPGMTANVTFVYADKQEVLRVPNAALRFRPPPELLGKAGTSAGRRGPPRPGEPMAGARGGGPDIDTPDRRVVWVLRNNEPVPVSVRVGTSDGSLTEVVSGDLKEGDSVITEASGGARRGGFGGGSSSGGPGGGMRRVF
jgi:HlyD family secretion protein